MTFRAASHTQTLLVQCVLAFILLPTVVSRTQTCVAGDNASGCAPSMMQMRQERRSNYKAMNVYDQTLRTASGARRHSIDIDATTHPPGNPNGICTSRPDWNTRPLPGTIFLSPGATNEKCRNPGGNREPFKYGETCKLECNTNPLFRGPGIWISCLGDDEWGDLDTRERNKWSGGACWPADAFDEYYQTLPRPTLEERKCTWVKEIPMPSSSLIPYASLKMIQGEADQAQGPTIQWTTPQGNAWSEAEKKEVKQILFENFYKQRGKNVFNSELPTAARIVRLGFHDCVKYEDGSGGCDGCIDMKDIDYRVEGNRRTDASLRTEKPPWINGNRGLEGAVAFIEAEIFNKALASNGGKSLKETGKSRADLWAFAVLVAIEFSTGVNNRHCDEPDLDRGTQKVVCLQDGDQLRGCKVTLPRDFVFQTGRRDCSTNLSLAYSIDKRDKLPGGDMSGGELTTWMKKEFQFTGRETVAIMGAHTLGNFHSSVTGYWYTVTSQSEDAFNNQYYRNLAGYDEWFIEPATKRDMDKSYYTCRKSGTAEGKRAKSLWRMKAQSAWTDLTPVQWIQHKFVCGNCEWAEHDEWPSGFTANSKTYVKNACQAYTECQADNSCQKRDAALQSKNIAQCKPGTEYWRFIWGRDEAATHTDMGMYYDFLVDKDGFPYNCPLLDKEQGEYFSNNGQQGKGNWDYLRKRSNFNVDHGCGLQKHAEPCGSTPLHQIVEEFAEDKVKWLEVFVPTVERMLRNGYGDQQLRDNGGVNALEVIGESGDKYWMKVTP